MVTLPEDSLAESPTQLLLVQAEQSAHTEGVSYPSGQPERSVLKFNFEDLLNFLGKEQDEKSELEMVCSFKGAPLPYIDINLNTALGWKGKLEFSYELSTAFIKYIADQQRGRRDQ
ncbi:hypothetical protein BS50DRAFT_682575 [Corynespora cassiicola Philippines]|uniref:Uncharacterized protein n=1 Tax=Corynespora cassiicola Philippines TaxID=1448308 RepID=A0A2T2N0B4_CORCC|nr:hypothetical protein BS50DRAFT_682575 [Corynespora cassiicola Philippines]